MTLQETIDRLMELRDVEGINPNVNVEDENSKVITEINYNIFFNTIDILT